MPTQTNYDHVKNELLQAKLKIIELEKKLQEYKNLKKVSFDEEGFHGEAKCLVCGEETETISMNVADIKPAKIKVNESK